MPLYKTAEFDVMLKDDPFEIRKYKNFPTEFVLPFDKLDSKFPEPKDERITFKEYVNESFASIKFSGSVNEELIQEKMKLLFEWIKEKDYIPK